MIGTRNEHENVRAGLEHLQKAQLPSLDGILVPDFSLS